MSQPATAAIEFKSFEKGLLTFTPDTSLPDGYFADCQNMLLTNKAPITIGGLTKFNTTACPSGNIVWFEPHTNSSGTTVMIVATDTGRVYAYNPSGDTWTELRRDFTSGILVWCSTPFRGQLIIANSNPDTIMKYDAAGTRLLPVGAISISDFEDAASWTGGSADTTEIREGRTSVSYAHGGAGSVNITRTLSTPLDLLTGLNGAPDFTSTDLVKVQMYVSNSANLAGNTPQQETSGTSGFNYIRVTTAAGQYDWSAQFTANANYSVRKIALSLLRVGTITGNVHIEIQGNAAGLPDNTPIANGTSQSVNFNDIPTSQSTVDFSFTTAPALVSGTVYHIVIKGSWTPDGVNYIQMYTSGASANNSAYNSSAAPTTWTEYSFPPIYQIYNTSSPVVIRLGTDASNYFEGQFSQVLSTGWNQLSLARSAFTQTLTPNWSSISYLYLSTTATGAVTVKFDDMYLIYNLAPPKAKLVEMYAQQLCVAGISTDPVLLKYSDAGTIDYFSADQEARFSGGRHALEKIDQITALYSYFDELIVGKVNSAWTFSGTGLNVSISALPLTIGIDAHHGMAETPWSVQYLFENNIFGARLTSRGLVSTNISSLLANLDNTQSDKTVALRHDRTHTCRWSFRQTTDAGSQNGLGLLYDYVLDAWASKYTPKIRWMTRAIVNGNREILCAQYDGYIRRMDVGTTFDGTAIESYITLPWVQHPDDQKDGHVSRWYNVTVYLKGTASVSIDARFADEPHEFASATFTSYGTVQATPDGDKGFAYLGSTARFMQLRLRATSLAFEVCPPIVIGTAPTERRV